ncbi:MAG TPA: hypothetical protein VN749_05085 [Candidatus Eisenbacteria bacterium]|jgi:hypothetical protein|nr:hypothetical protein [Candidatus Eisenbacteria bacterium]
MHRNNSDPSLWYLLPPDTEPPASLRRSNLIAIAVLAFFTLGMLVVGFVRSNGHAAAPGAGSALATGKHQFKVGAPPPPVQHVR